MKKNNLLILFLLSLLSITSLYASTRRYRLSLRDDPSTSVVIGWEQNGGSGATVYYGTTDHGTNWSSYANSHTPDRTVSESGMDNSFARLTGLTPNTAYYFVVKDSDGTSDRFWFKTTPMGNTIPLSIIAGGDSRAYLDDSPRENANTLVSKIRPDFVMFGGDYTWLDTSIEWSGWMDDWQLTTSPDGRMYPVIWERGNHELSAGKVYNLFDVPSADEYYNIPVGGSFMNIYTLNTEISVAGNQKSWLENQLQTTADNYDWNIAQYHRSIRPHTTTKSNEDGQYNAWAQIFYDYQVRLVIESDAHDVKTTWPVKPSTGPSSDDGYELDSIRGTVYIGEGCWGAPLRTNDNDRSWTKDSDSFNSFNWIKVTRDTIEIRTLGTDNAASVNSLTDNNRFDIPANANLWTPSNGSVTYITNNKYLGRPEVGITYPFQQQYFSSTQNINITADASDVGGSVQEVKFYVNDVFVGSDFSAPYSYNWTIPSDDEYVITAWAIDNDGWHNVSDNTIIHVGQTTIVGNIINNDDDAEEYKDDGSVDLSSTDLELCIEDWVWPISDEDQWVGLRFQNLAIPQGATISGAYIQFTSDSDESDPATATIYAQDIDNATIFLGNDYNLSSRTRTSTSIPWTHVGWNDGDETTSQRTPEIKQLVQQIVNRPGWQLGNSMAFLFEGTGTRSAYSRDEDAGKSPTLHITYTHNSGGGPSSVSQEIKEEFVKIYPNPVSEVLQIELSKDQGELRIYDLEGRLIKTDLLNAGNNSYNISNLNLNTGIYLFEINAENQKSIKKVIIK